MSMPSPTGSVARPGAFRLSQREACALTGGTWIGAAREAVLHGATIDSRHVHPGALFACLVGGQRDGHDFAPTAVGDGAALVLASRALAVPVPVPVLLVADVTRALAQLAGLYRQRRSATVWIGVTGSNGKSTVKELIAAALSGPGRVVHATRGNLNNHLGVPLSVLATPESATHAVIEMGANHPGEIAQLCAIAAPGLGAITSIGPAHLEGFLTLRGVAQAKGELLAALPESGVGVVGVAQLAATCAAAGADPAEVLAALRARAAGRRLVLIGGEGEAVRGAVRSDGLRLDTAAGSCEIPLLGEHNLANAALAYAVAGAAGIPGAEALQGLAAMRPIAGRLLPRPCGAHRLLDDSYNANPASMAAGLQVLALAPGRRLAVLGGMGELGTSAESGHRAVGEEAARLGLPLISVGAGARAILAAYRAAGGSDGEHAADQASALAVIRSRLAAGPTTVLVKASRAAGLDQLVQALLADAADRPATPPTPAGGGRPRPRAARRPRPVVEARSVRP